MTDEPQPPGPAPENDPKAGIDQAFRRLVEILPYAEGGHYATLMNDRTVRVVSHDGPVLAASGTAVTAPDAVEAVRTALTAAGIRAAVSQMETGETMIATDLATPQAVTALTQLLTDAMPSTTVLVKDLFDTLRAAGFSNPGCGIVLSDRICDVPLSLDDVHKILVALGGPDEKRDLDGPELYAFAEQFAAQLGRALGGEVTINAFPARECDRGAYHHALLVIEWLTFDQARALIKVLTPRPQEGR